MAFSTERKGELLVLASIALWSAFPIVAILTYAYIPPLFTLAGGTFLAAVFFAALMTYRKRWKEIHNPLLIRYSVLIALTIGVAYHGFYFVGLTYTSAGNASLIALLEIFTSYVFFNIIKKETFPLEHKIGAGLMLLGSFIILAKNFSSFALGDFLVLAAVFFPPLGNFYTQKAREFASTETIMFLRSALTVPVLILLAFFLGETISLSGVMSALPLLVVSGILLFGLSKFFFIEAIHRISVTKSLALASMTPLLTLLLAWAILQQEPTIWQMASLVPLVAGTLLLTGHVRLRGRSA